VVDEAFVLRYLRAWTRAAPRRCLRRITTYSPLSLGKKVKGQKVGIVGSVASATWA